MQPSVMNIPYIDLPEQHAPIKEKLLEAVGKVLDHGNFILGEEVAEFERRFAKLCDVPYAVGVASGTDALILALRALGIRPGDEVITVSNSFVSSVSCIVCVGAKPVFVDVGDDYLIDPYLIEAVITPKTKAILPVHLTGRPANMDVIMAIAKKHRLVVVEDCAQAVNAEFREKKVGSFGDTGCFSLHPLKTLNACGDGGVITIKDKEVYEKILVLRNNGLLKYKCVEWSSNSRLDSIQAAILLVKLDYLEKWTQEHRHNASLYREHLKDIPQIQLPLEEKGIRAVYHTFVIQAERRDDLQIFLAEKGIGTKIHYKGLIHLSPAGLKLGYKEGSLPKSEAQAEKVLSFPVSIQFDKGMMEYIKSCLLEFYRT